MLNVWVAEMGKKSKPKGKSGPSLTLIVGGVVALGVVGFALSSLFSTTPKQEPPKQDSLHALTATLIDGRKLSLDELAGKPCLMVNVASR